MKLVSADKVVDVIAKGDLLTVLEERENDYVILTHDGTKGAVAKVNAVRVPESVDIYTDLIATNPNEGRYFTLRASAWWGLGKTDQAMADFDRAIELGYEKSHAYNSRGLFHSAAGRHDQAIADFDKAISIDPDDDGPLVNRAAAYLSKGNAKAAIKDYDQAIKNVADETGKSNLLHQRAVAYKADGQLDKAAADFDAILADQPDDLRAVMGRGYVRFQQQRHREAIEDFSKAIELNPNDPIAWNNRGYNRYQTGKYKLALADYARAIELAPTYGLALQNQAWALATVPDEALRDPKAAVKSAEAACKLTNYASVGDLSALAAALAANGQFQSAVGWQEKVVELVGKPYRAFAKKTLERYQEGKPFSLKPDEAK